MKRNSFITVAVILIACALAGADELTKCVDSALKRAGDNAAELRKAIDKAPETQKEGVRFLIAYMPDRDLTTLSAEFLLNNVRGAYKAWDNAPWKKQITKEMFLNDVLPYASVNERRDDWREDFYKRFSPLVAKAKTPGAAAVILNEKVFKTLNVHFSRKRPKADQSPYETIKAGMASCTGMTVLFVDACRAVGIPARFAGTPLWTNKSGNHSWAEVWDGKWHFTGAGEPADGKLDKAWFTKRATTAQKGHRLHAIYAVSFKRTETTFPMVWAPRAKYVYAVNVTDRYAKLDAVKVAPKAPAGMDVEASLHAVDQLKKYLQTAPEKRAAIDKQNFASVALSADDAKKASAMLWADHVARIKKTRAAEMKARVLSDGEVKMPFYYSVTGKPPEGGRSLYISLHGGGGAPKRVNDGQWNNQKRLYKVPEGVYVAPRAPTDAWNMWHKGHIDVLFARLIENLIVFEGVDPNRVYLLGYSAGGDGVYRLAPRMADRWAAASMMAGHPGGVSMLNLRNTPFSIQVGGKDAAYKRNEKAKEYGDKLDALQKADSKGYVHFTKIYANCGHWMNRKDAIAIPWMAKYDRNPLPTRIVWRQDKQQARFYWLATSDEAKGGAVVRADLKAQTITLDPGEAQSLTIRLNDTMLDLDKPVIVAAGDKPLHKARLTRTIRTLAKTLSERGDTKSIFSAEIVVKLPAKPTLQAQLGFPFRDNAVLQQKINLPIWGTSLPAARVTVAFDGQTKSVDADEKGGWRVVLDPMGAVKLKSVNESPVGKSLTITCRKDGKKAVKEIKNILIGDVWLCAGQSNMAGRMKRAGHPKNYPAGSVKNAKYPALRLLSAPKDNWLVCDPETAVWFSRVSFFFARRVQRDALVPMGLIVAAQGGSSIESWVNQPPYPTGGNYSNLLKPVVGYGIRGAIWYQGESNEKDRRGYQPKLKSLITGWRKVWKQGDFPVHFVQLPGIGKSTTDTPAGGDGRAEIRQAYFEALKLPNTGMAVTIDIGALGEHPPNKYDTGVRLARSVLQKVYGFKGLSSCPLYTKHSIKGNTVRIFFDNAQMGLMIAKKEGFLPPKPSPEAKLQWLSIQDKDGDWHWADGKIDGSVLLVSSAAVKQPVAVRYAYTQHPCGNLLYNKDGMPVGPFSTCGYGPKPKDRAKKK